MAKKLRRFLSVLVGAWLVLQGPVDAFAQFKTVLPPVVPFTAPLGVSAPLSAPGVLSAPAALGSLQALPSLDGTARLQPLSAPVPVSAPSALPQAPLSASERADGWTDAPEAADAGPALGAAPEPFDSAQGKPGAVREASRIRSELTYKAAVLRSFWWYGTTRVQSYYDQYLKASAKNPEPAVRDSRRFLADLRVFGTEGRFNALGFQYAEDAVVKADALKLYSRFVKAGPEAEAAFRRFADRAETFNPGARRSYYRKQLRNALWEGALRPASGLPAYFDSLLTPAEKAKIDAYRADGMDRDREAFVATVKEALAAVPAGRGRPVAAILLGSHASRLATPESDFDLEVVTADGRFDGVTPFITDLHKRWKAKGGTIKVEAHSYALPVSGWLVAGIHREAREVISNDPAVASILSSGKSAPRGSDFWAPFAKWTHWAMSHATMAWAAFKASGSAPTLRAPEASDGHADAHAARGPPALKKAKWGIILSRTPSIVSFILTNVAFPLLAATTPGVGSAGYAAILAFGSVPMVAFGPLIGRLADHVDLRKLMLINSALRVFIYGASAALVFTGSATFAWLLLLSVLNSINTVSTITAEGSLVSHLWGKDPKESSDVNSMLQFNYLSLQVVLGIALKIGHAADVWGIGWTYVAGAALVLALNFPLIWGMVPKLGPADAVKEGGPQGSFWKAILKLLKEGAATLPKQWPQLGVMAAGVAASFFVPQTIRALPIVGALVVWIGSTSTFREIWANRDLRNPMLLYGALSLLFFPVQSLVVPMAAKILSHGAADGELLGQIQGALYAGQLLAAAVMIKMTKLHRFLLVAAISGGVGFWSFLQVFPGSLPTAVAAGAATTALAWGVSRFTDRAWLQLVGAGLAFIWLPFFHWGVPPLLLSVALVGLFYAPLQVLLLSHFGSEVRKKAPERAGTLIGIQGAFMSALTGLGYAIFGWALNRSTPALPAGFELLGWLFAAAGLAFIFGPRWIGGLSKKLFHKDGMHHKDGVDEGGK